MMVKVVLSLAVAVLLCGCLLPLPTTLQVRGYVLDATTKRPVAGARVIVKDHPKAAVTANDGSFDIPSETHWGFIVPPQEPVGLEDTVIVTKAGYRSKTIRPSQRPDILLERE
jgi:hypothetical protein